MPNVLAFVSFVALTSFTPGPNNIMSMSNAARFGFRRSMSFNAGVAAGFFIILALAIAFSIGLYAIVPVVKPYVTVVGAGYILWLAYKTLTAPPHSAGARVQTTFFSGLVLQFLNPKAVLYGLTVASTFIVPYYRSPLTFAAFAAALSLVALLSTSTWALFGSVFQRFMEKHHRAVGLVMAGLLVYCAVSLFL